MVVSSGAREEQGLRSMRSTPPRLRCLRFKALSDWHYWHLGEIASCQATMAEGISLAKELIEFDPEKVGRLAERGQGIPENPGSILRAGLEIEDAGASRACARPGVSKRLPVCRQQDPGR